MIIAPLLDAPMSRLNDAQLDAIIAQLVGVAESLRRCGDRHSGLISDVYADMARYADERERRRHDVRSRTCGAIYG